MPDETSNAGIMRYSELGKTAAPTPEEVLREDIEDVRGDLRAARREVARQLGYDPDTVPETNYPPLAALNRIEARIRELEAELKEVSDSVVAAGMYETLTHENARLRADLAEARETLRAIHREVIEPRPADERLVNIAMFARIALSHQGEPTEGEQG